MNQQLLDYVRQQLGAGISSDNLHKILTPQGWTAEDINQAITTVTATKPVAVAPPVVTASVAQATPAVKPVQTMPATAMPVTSAAAKPATPAATMPATATPVTPAVGVRVASIQPVASQMSAQKGLSGTAIAGVLIAFLLIGGTATFFLVPELKSNVFGFVSHVTGLQLEDNKIVDPVPRQTEVVPTVPAEVETPVVATTTATTTPEVAVVAPKDFIAVQNVAGATVIFKVVGNSEGSCAKREYKIDFGDGEKGSVEVPAGVCTQKEFVLPHTYKTSGTFTVLLHNLTGEHPAMSTTVAVTR